MEFVIVEFEEDRGVLIDGTPSGNTNQTLMVEEGHHEFSLEPPMDYTPESQEILVQNTLPDDPERIVFERAGNGSGGGGND